MTIIVALGSRGDVQPMAVLAGALARQGSDARVVALRDYEDVAASEGAAFVPIDASITDALDSTRTRLGRIAVSSPAGQGLLLRRWSASIAEAVADAVLGTIRPGEAVLTGVLTRDVATALAEKGGRRAATIAFTGQAPTEQRESHFFHTSFTRFGPWNRWGTRFNWQTSSNIGAPIGREVRRRLGLPIPSSAQATAAADRHPTFLAVSPTLVPPAPDWPPGFHQTGYLAPQIPTVTPDADLAAILSDEPVYVGFGSMTSGSDHHSLDLVTEAAARAGRRVLTPALPGMAPGPVSEWVHAIAPLPHGWLFPRCTAVIHHGGAGTTQEGLRAGVPSAAVPFGVDQPYHAWRLHRLGVGPEPVRIRALTPARLAVMIHEMTDAAGAATYRARAADVGAQVRAEQGVRDTVALVNELIE